MKKNVWLLSMMFIACTFATAQIRVPQQAPSFKRVNTQALDAHRQGYSHNASRMADTPIEIDYGFSDDDTSFLVNFINMHFSTPLHDNLERYAVVAFDSLHDAGSNTGYKYSDFDSVHVDSLFFFVGHKNADLQSDTLIVKLVQLNATGAPTNTVLWTQTYTSGASSFIQGQTPASGRWDAIGKVGISPNMTFPSTTKLGVRLEYYGAVTDSFAYLFSWFNTGTCVNSNLPYRADRSVFWPNSYRFDVANGLVLPTATGVDYAYDCIGDSLLDSPYIIQNINFSTKLTGIDAGPQGPKVRLLRVNPVTDDVTIKNFGDVAQNITTYRLCTQASLYTNNLSGETILGGSLNLNPGDTVKLHLTSISLVDAGSDLGLYMNSLNFGDPANMLDFTQWLSGGHGRESVAVAKGIWGAGHFVSGDEPYSYIGNGFEDGVSFWEGYQAPPVGCDTLSNFDIAIDTPSLYFAPGGGYISGHNSFGDISKADSFHVTTSSTVTGVFLAFGVAEFASPASVINVRVWSGTGGTPGTVLASVIVPINSLSTTGIPNFVTFPTPPVVSGDFFVGINFAYAANDTVALLTNTLDNGRPNTAWEQWSDNTWHPYSGTNGWQASVSHVIFPIVCVSAGCPTITVNATSTNAVCTSINGTATAVATGGTAPYTYAWSNTFTGGTVTGLAGSSYTVTATDANGCMGTTSVTVSVSNVTLGLVVTDTDNTSCGAPNGTATAAAAGGTNPYSYVWSGGNGVTALISNLAAGTYTVTAFDANGCSGTGSTTVGSAPPTLIVTASASTPNTQCINPNGSATASTTGGTPAYTYLWPASASNQAGATAINLQGGNYLVTATDAAGCTGTGNIVVGTTTPTITVSVTNSTPSTSCAAPDGSATVSATGGTGPHTYQWPSSAGSQTGATATALGGGTYTVTATDAGGCTGTGDVTITATTPTITVTETNSTGNSSCTTANGDATVSVTGGTGPYQVAWSGGGTGTSLTGLQNGTYTITATDANSCTGTTSVTIADNRPVLSVSIATNPVTSCIDDNGSATATESGATGSVTITWGTSPAQTGPTASNLAAGNYTVTVLDQSSGCTVSGSATIGTNTPAVSVTIPAKNDVTNCDVANGSATASGSGGAGGFSYVWSNGDTGATADSLDAGSYTVTVTSTNGCTASASETIVTNTATVTVDVTTTPVTSCANANGSAVAVATGGATPYTYLWNGAQTTSTLNNIAAGVYSVTVSDANGCEGSDNGTVGTNVIQPTVTTTVVNESGTGENDGSATATGAGGNSPYTYAWSTSPAQTTSTATGLGDGTYSVTVTDASGCTATATATILEVGIALPADVSSLSLFPNPTMDVVNVRMELKEAQHVKIEWFNAIGQSVIVREFLKVNAVSEQFSLGALPEGIYLARITVGSESVTSRISVAR